MIKAISFTGIVKPYINNNGIHVTPIAINPSQEDINEAIMATKVSTPHSGMNGDAYFYGQDLVVKKYKPQGEALKFDPNREIKALDSLYENGIRNPNIQQGLFAFTTDKDESYLVSTKISGSKPSYEKNKFNKDNLEAMVQLISDLDLPHKVENGKNFPFEFAMHYDLSPGNVTISEDKAGLIDFEYLEYDDLNKRLFGQMLGIKKANSDFSDLAGIPSNLRNFECRTLYDYLFEESPQEAQQTFKTYLYTKGIKYHCARANYFKMQQEMAKQENNEELAELCGILAKKENSHATALIVPDHNIYVAEALKIQMAHFIHIQSQFANSGAEKVNTKQIADYIENSLGFFKHVYNRYDLIEKTTGKSVEYLKDYYEDCIRLTQNWQAIIPRMQTKEKRAMEMPTLYNEKDIAEYNSKHYDRYDTLQIFKRKLTNEHQTTLDEHLHI